MIHRRPRTTALLALTVTVLVAAASTGQAHEAHRKQKLAEQAPAADLQVPAAEPQVTHEPHEAHEALSFWQWLGKLHPATVHFPIALLLTAVVSELLLAATGNELYRHSTRVVMWGGVVGAVLSAPLGWLFAEPLADDDWLLRAHRVSGTATALLGVVALVLCERFYRRGDGELPFRVALGLCALAVGAAGLLGGSLVYGIDHLSW
jgi:uncharacterized membrane protein